MLMRRYGWPSSSWREMQRLRRRMDRLMRDWPASATGLATPGYPAVNVWTSDEGSIVTAELPGLDPKDIDISVQDSTLTLRGTRQAAEASKDKVYHRRERGTGAFARTVDLPFRVEQGQVEATFAKGVLTIALPRAKEDKPTKIAVKAG